MANTHYLGAGIYLAWAFFCLAVGAEYAALSLFVSRREAIGGLRMWALAALWVAAEASRFYFMSGFSWNLSGLTLAAYKAPLQMASLCGVLGMSSWVVLTNCAAFNLYRTRRIGPFLFFAAFPYAVGGLLLLQPLEEKGEIAALLIQTGIRPEERDFVSDRARSYIPAPLQWDRILGMVENNLKDRIDLIVLPEGALPHGPKKAIYPPELFALLLRIHFGLALAEAGENRSNSDFAQAVSDVTGADLIVGMEDREREKQWNAAFLFCPQSPSVQRYEKRVLVPIGEYLPFGGWKPLADWIHREFGIAGSFKAGSTGKVLNGRCKLGIAICYEETFPHIIRELKEQGAELLVSISNDVWFPFSTLPSQHFSHGKIRAVENGVPLLRACNTGVTGAVDCQGGEIAILDIAEFQRGALRVQVPIATRPTLYAACGNAPVWAIGAIGLFLFFVRRKTAAS
jgi:apolipoprotein N-acyltransferase